MPERVLMTGITGFIGGHLAEYLLLCGVEVHAVVRSAEHALPPVLASVCLHSVKSDGTGLRSVIEHVRPQTVYHLAACYCRGRSDEELDAMLQSNVALGVRLAQAVLDVVPQAVLVSASTVFQHGKDKTYDPVNLYAATKQAQDDLFLAYARCYGLRWQRLFLPDTYGPNDRRGKLLALLRRAVDADRPVPMTSGEQELELLHVHDVVHALCCAAARARAGADDGEGAWLLLGSEGVRTLRDVASVYQSLVAGELRLDWGRLPYPARTLMQLPRAIPLLPGWCAKWTLRDGLRQTLLADGVRLRPSADGEHELA